MSRRPGPVPSRDRGLQPERTSLAWRRTILAMGVADLFIWRGWLASLNHTANGDSPIAHTGHSLGLGICAAAAAGTTAVLTVCAILRKLELRGARLTYAAPPAPVLRTAAGSVVVLAMAAVAAILLG